MPINDFLPFAIDEAANVQPQGDYLYSTSTKKGFVMGRAHSAEANKVWRQASFIAAGLAQYVLEERGVDVLDDGDLPSFVEKLRWAIYTGAGAYIGDTPPPLPQNGDFWWDSVGGRLYFWYVDPDSSQWVGI
jgi:hypothetical protein